MGCLKLDYHFSKKVVLWKIGTGKKTVQRFVSVDPLQFDYPELTPFQYASNRPVACIDLDGLTELKAFDKKTNNNIILLAEKVLKKVETKSAELNKYEGTDGVNAETSRNLPAGSNAQKMQDGTLPIRYQGKILSN